MDRPAKTITTVQQIDTEGNVISETVTTTITENVKEPETPPTGMYL